MIPYWIRPGALSLALALLSACAATPEGGTSRAGIAEDPARAPEPGEGFDIGALPPQRLEPGECGLFLFAPRPTPRFVFFSNATTGYARMLLDGEEVVLSRSAAEGEVFDQNFADTSYVAPAIGLHLRVRVRPGAPAEGGTEIDAGSLNLRRKGGWSVVIPVAGASTCQPAS